MRGESGQAKPKTLGLVATAPGDAVYQSSFQLRKIFHGLWTGSTRGLGFAAARGGGEFRNDGGLGVRGFFCVLF